MQKRTTRWPRREHLSEAPRRVVVGSILPIIHPESTVFNPVQRVEQWGGCVWVVVAVVAAAVAAAPLATHAQLTARVSVLELRGYSAHMTICNETNSTKLDIWHHIVG